MKTIIFDFDGTLTTGGYNIWKRIWHELGYPMGQGSYFKEIFDKFMQKEISHQEWCNLTCAAYIKKGMNYELLKKLSKEIELLGGFKDTMMHLKSKGYSLHILSGNIKEVVYDVLGESCKYFDSITANHFNFSMAGRLIEITSRNYDYEGKARFVNEYKKKTGTSARDILFVGNGDNDEWVHTSGCSTLCVNPHKTDPTNKVIWKDYILQMTDLKQLLPKVEELQKSNRDKEREL